MGTLRLNLNVTMAVVRRLSRRIANEHSRPQHPLGETGRVRVAESQPNHRFSLGLHVAHCLVPIILPANWAAPSLPKDVAARSLKIDNRKLQFEAGRRHAATLLASLGSLETRVCVNSDRSPIWPTGYVGSITHTDTLLAVAVGREHDLRGIGIDIEAIVTAEVAEGINLICLNQNEMELGLGVGLDCLTFSSLCFSAKESLFKCLYPLVKQFFGFQAVEIIRLDMQTKKLYVCLLQDLSEEFLAGFILRGHFYYDCGHVFTSFELPSIGSA